MRRPHIKLTVCFLLLLLTPVASAEQPNVVVVITDDQGYGDLGFTGNPVIKTPYLDKLAAESVWLEDFHVAPSCSPTRSAMLTGRWTNRTGVWHTFFARALMYENEVTIAEHFQAAGYATGMFGKWHLGDHYPYRPQDRGFDHTYCIRGGATGVTADYWNNDYFDDHHFRNGEATPSTGYSTDVFYAESQRFIKEQVARLRKWYENWWAELEPTFSRTSPLYVGSPETPELQITALQWINQAPPWNHGLVRQAKLPSARSRKDADGIAFKGHWFVHVAQKLTGRYPMRCGMPVARNENVAKYQRYALAPDELTIPELLKPAGYRSLMVGKWHLGMEVEGSHPLDAGFDEHLGIPSNYETKRGSNYDTLYRGRQVEKKNVRCQELTRIYTEEVVDFIQRQKDNPFFIYVSHHIVHSPLLPSKNFVGTSKKGKYGDFIKELDHSTGRIMKALSAAGLDDNTLVVFTSDNGPTRAGSTGGLAGGKYCSMEGGHRVPGIFRWPGKIPSGQVSDVTLTSMDLLPLFCSLASVELPADRKIDGNNILPVLLGKETGIPHKLLYYYNGTNLQAVREGDWKLHLPRTAADQPFWSKDPRHKWKGFVTLNELRLFDLNNDVGEKQNVADLYPDVVVRLQKQSRHDPSRTRRRARNRH